MRDDAAAPAPLAGKRVLVTRPRAQASKLCDKLAALGAQPILFPTIEIAPLQDFSALDRAIRELDTYQWLILTSVNGVSAFWDRLACAGRDASALAGIQVAAIGPATAQALAARGVQARFVPEEYVAEAILDGIGDVRGQRILLPRADIAREALAVELARRGAQVDEIAAYRTLPAQPDPEGLASLERGVDAITFTSSSTVRNFVALLGSDAWARYTVPGGQDRPVIACIGPITAQTARELGLPVDVMASEYTMDGLIAALVKAFQLPG